MSFRTKCQDVVAESASSRLQRVLKIGVGRGVKSSPVGTVVGGEPRVFIKGKPHMDPYRLTPTLKEILSWRKETHPLLGVDVLIGKNGHFKQEDRVAFCSFRGFLWYIQLPLGFPGIPRDWKYMGVTLVSRVEVLQTFERSDLKKDIEELRGWLIWNNTNDGDTPPDATESHSLIDLKGFWDDTLAWRKEGDEKKKIEEEEDTDDWNSDDDEEEETQHIKVPERHVDRKRTPKSLKIVGNEVPFLPLYEEGNMYRQVVDNSELNDFWNEPDENKKCLVPHSLFQSYFRVRQLDVSQTVLDQMCSPLTNSPDLRKGLTRMANITSISDVLDNPDLHALIVEHVNSR